MAKIPVSHPHRKRLFIALFVEMPIKKELYASGLSLRRMLCLPQFSGLIEAYQHPAASELWQTAMMAALHAPGLFEGAEAAGMIAFLFHKWADTMADMVWMNAPSADEVYEERKRKDDDYHRRNNADDELTADNQKSLEDVSIVKKGLPVGLVELLHRIPHEFSHWSKLAAVSIVSPKLSEIIKAFETASKESAEKSKEEQIFLQLHRIVRTGWTRVIPAFRAGVDSGAENVAQHSIKTAFLAAALRPDNPGRLFCLGICHDHAELKTGDLTPGQYEDHALKHENERKIYRQMAEQIANSINAPGAMGLAEAFDEVMDDCTEDAHLIHICDKLDMAIQAAAYEKVFHINLSEFFISAQTEILHEWDLIEQSRNCSHNKK